MTREEAISILEQRKCCRECVADCTCKECDDAFDMAIKSLEQEPCVCIDRANAMTEIMMFVGNKKINGDIYIKVSDAVELVRKLPSVTSTSKTGHCKWFKYDYRTICPSEHDIDNPYWRIPDNMEKVLKYCPYCGKEIEVEND